GVPGVRGRVLGEPGFALAAGRDRERGRARAGAGAARAGAPEPTAGADRGGDDSRRGPRNARRARDDRLLLVRRPRLGAACAPVSAGPAPILVVRGPPADGVRRAGPARGLALDPWPSAARAARRGGRLAPGRRRPAQTEVGAARARDGRRPAR